MEKFNFLRFAKISCLALGVFVLSTTSCSNDQDDEGLKTQPDPEIPGRYLDMDEFGVIYPENSNFGAWNEDTITIGVGDRKTRHNDKFKTLLTMDTLSKSVRISYYTLVEPETVEASDLESIATTYAKDYYCDDNGHELLGNETVAISGYNAIKLTAHQFWYKDSAGNIIECDNYKERYLIYESNFKKVYMVVLELPNSLKSSRYSELVGIVSTLKIKK